MSDDVKMLGVKLPLDLIARLDNIVTRRYSNRGPILREFIIAGIIEQEKILAQRDAETRRHFEQFAPSDAA